MNKISYRAISLAKILLYKLYNCNIWGELTSVLLVVSGHEVELWMCSKRLKRTKNDLCEIDLVMSSLRDIAQEL